MIAKQPLNFYSKYMDQQRGFSVLKIIMIVVLLLSLIAGIYLATHPQVFRSKAGSIGSGWVNALEMTDQGGNRIVCNTATDPPECTTNTPVIKVKVINQSLLTQ